MNSEMLPVVIVGGGKMGGALLAGWLASQEWPAASLVPENMTVVNPGAARRAFLEETYGVACVAQAGEVAEAGMVVLAVKPQVMFEAIEQINANPAFSGSHLFVSIAAGIPTARLEAALPEGARVVRVMPNTPLMVGQGASAVCGSASATSEDVAFVESLFACMGSACIVSEQDMDAVCALSGSGPAYVDAFIEALRDGAVAEGLDRELAEQLAVQTVLGAAALLQQTDTTPEKAREAVCSPGGTTLAGLDALYAAGFNEAVAAAVAAAARRSKELAQ